MRRNRRETADDIADRVLASKEKLYQHVDGDGEEVEAEPQRLKVSDLVGGPDPYGIPDTDGTDPKKLAKKYGRGSR